MANLVYYVMSTTEAKLFLVGTGKLIPNPPEVMQRVMEQQIRQVIAQFKAIGDVGGEVRATLLYSQWHEVNGNAAEAASVARSVRGIAEAMGMDEEMRRIDAVIQGNSPFQISLTQIANPGDRDYRRATQTDEEARRIARFHLGFLRLPEDRLPVIERAELIIRDAILVKYEWCQHFELLEELTHEGNPHFHYATDPTWQPECTKHRRRGLILTDASLVIDSFKRCQCSACADRCPRPKPKFESERSG